MSKSEPPAGAGAGREDEEEPEGALFRKLGRLLSLPRSSFDWLALSPKPVAMTVMRTVSPRFVVHLHGAEG